MSNGYSDEHIDRKLPHATEHLDANRRMMHLTSYYEWILAQTEGRLGKTVIDAGCGIGNFVEVLRDSTNQVYAVDLNPANIDILHKRFDGIDRVEVLQVDLDLQRSELAELGIDSVVCLDVLEHIEDDTRLLISFQEIVRPGGTLFLKVPAVPWLYGSIDVASDHHRRYSKKDLVAKVKRAGWTIKKARYMNLAGVLPYFLKSRIFRRDTALSSSYTPRQIKMIERSMKLVRLLDEITGPPIGQSLVIVAEKEF
ncbi:MAG: class I SAM-dependent methyltransferase [Halioglobus sp.]